MSLMLRIIQSDKITLDDLPVLDFVLNERACLIGRSHFCHWRLLDQEKILSGIHCIIQYLNHEYYIIDNSLNGVFHNRASQPIGKGRGELLYDGDVISLGDYQIEVSLTATYTQQGQPSHPGAT